MHQRPSAQQERNGLDFPSRLGAQQQRLEAALTNGAEVSRGHLQARGQDAQAEDEDDREGQEVLTVL